METVGVRSPCECACCTPVLPGATGDRKEPNAMLVLGGGEAARSLGLLLRSVASVRMP
jgi:hypothetical protein